MELVTSLGYLGNLHLFLGEDQEIALRQKVTKFVHYKMYAGERRAYIRCKVDKKTGKITLYRNKNHGQGKDRLLSGYETGGYYICFNMTGSLGKLIAQRKLKPWGKMWCRVTISKQTLQVFPPEEHLRTRPKTKRGPFPGAATKPAQLFVKPLCDNKQEIIPPEKALTPVQGSLPFGTSGKRTLIGDDIIKDIYKYAVALNPSNDQGGEHATVFPLVAMVCGYDNPREAAIRATNDDGYRTLRWLAQQEKDL